MKWPFLISLSHCSGRIPEDLRQVYALRDEEIRESIDFAMVSAASAITLSGGVCSHARIVLGAVAPMPVRAKRAEDFLAGKELTPEVCSRAAATALENAKPLSMNAYKIPIGKTLVRESIQAARPV